MSITKNNTRMLEGDIDASNITGVLPVANGGTGSSTAPDDSTPAVPDAGAIGAYSFGRPLSAGAIAIGATSTAFYAWQENNAANTMYFSNNASVNGTTVSQTGTWRCMSGCAAGFTGLWLRIS
tara:strand:- start:286 stop:654 length:369 start_codon:yes stop_codon:yes gene_type:complete